MRRLLLFMVLVLVCAGQVEGPYGTQGIPNGLAWRAMPYQEKGAFVAGILYGAQIVGNSVLAGSLPACPTSVDLPKWGDRKPNDVVQVVDAFYENAANIPIPMPDGVVYALMKLNGATKEQLDNYRSTMLIMYVH
jgi:hypothetical protein